MFKRPDAGVIAVRQRFSIASTPHIELHEVAQFIGRAVGTLGAPGKREAGRRRRASIRDLRGARRVAATPRSRATA